MGKAQSRRTLQPKIDASLPAQQSEADTTAQPNRAGAGPASAQDENHLQQGQVSNEDEIDNWGNRTDNRIHGGDAVRESGGRTELSSVGARTPETEVSNDQTGETHGGAIVAGDSGHRRAGDDARVSEPQSAGAGDVSGASVGDSGTVGRHAAIRDRLAVPAFDSANFPVQEKASLSAEPVQAEISLPVENKALPAQPVQAEIAACPVLASWRQVEGIWLPRYFTAVPHLKYERTSLSSAFKPVTETKTGWQIQWNTACPVCGKRFRPVAGFITILHVERMKEMNDDEQQAFVAKIIRDKFAAGVSGQHPKCAG